MTDLDHTCAEASVLIDVVVSGKSVNRPFGAIVGCDFQPLSFAPFGNLVRVCFDPDDDRAGRDAAKDCAKLFLPALPGFHHVVVGEFLGSFVVALAPHENGHDNIVVSILHRVRSSFSRLVSGWHAHHGGGDEGRPVLQTSTRSA